ncbi:aldo/keto reductase [Ihubacter sp. rT4E-8]|uniref:aldo/keto reductase n=1 Tax=Ihubacter sp. rT4E-8 TaxID=3242369 RepID=UPI003CEE3981
MQYQDFYGKKISTLGLGGLRFPTVDGDLNRIDRAAGQKVVDAAMQQGINVFDTAWSYQDGDSERFLGEALAKYPRESFLLGLSGVQTVFSGMADASQVIENAALFDAPKPLSDAERKTLQRAADAFFKTMGVPCSGCRYCCGICPAGLEIPLLIKGYNEQNITGSTWKIGMLSETKGASACLSCGACLSRCPQKIDIPGVMKKLAEQQ